MTPAVQQMVPLFFSPLLVLEVDDHAALNSQLLAELAGLQRASPGLQASNQGGWHSARDFFSRREPGCRALAQRIIAAIRQATETVAPGFEFAAVGLQGEGWINVSGRGAFNTPHDHPGWAWSGTYYVQVPEDPHPRAGCLEFLDSRTNIRAISIAGASCFHGKYLHRPVAGTVVLFPACLQHWLYPHQQDEPRISIAFNARFGRPQNGISLERS